MSERFLVLTFDGGRFLAHSAPVDVLAELATIQQLVLKIARHLYLKSYPNRRRVPRGFPEAAQLFLVAAEANCYTAVLERPGSWPGSSLADRDYFDRAGELIVAALGAPQSGALPEGFPSSANDNLASLGKCLAADERILLRTKFGTDVRVDQESRLQLSKMIGTPIESFESLEGEVDQIDDVTRSFTVRSQTGRRVVLNFAPTDRENLLEALRLRPIVRVRARGWVASGSSPRMRVVDLDLFDDDRSADVLKVWERLKSFEDITDGWYEGEGWPPSRQAIELARGVLGRLLVEHPYLPRPGVFPTPEGGVQAEWILGKWAADVGFESEDERIQADATHAETGEERSVTFSRDQVNADSAGPLGGWLQELDRWVGLQHHGAQGLEKDGKASEGEGLGAWAAPPSLSQRGTCSGLAEH